MVRFACGWCMRLKVLEAGGRRCAICGATHKDRMLDVDHIIPRSKGGPSTFDNLQVLCSKCNRAKGNRSDRDFRVAESSQGHEECSFCALPTLTDFPAENDLSRAIWYDTVSGRQLCIIPKRHVHTYVALTSHEILAMHDLVRVMHSRDPMHWVSTVLLEEGHVRVALNSSMRR